LTPQKDVIEFIALSLVMFSKLILCLVDNNFGEFPKCKCGTMIMVRRSPQLQSHCLKPEGPDIPEERWF